jgi:multimeric flavodoxin WrbA
LLESSAQGARECGAEVEQFHLYDLNYKGCVSCFACKLRENAVTICAMRDDLRPVLEAIHGCDALVIGSPVYWHEVSGETRCLIERLLYPCISYDKQPGSPEAGSRFGRQIKVAMFFTMGANEEMSRMAGFFNKFDAYKNIFSGLLGPTECLASCGTWQFDDYSRYATGMFDVPAVWERHNTVFVEEKQAAKNLLVQMLT